MDNDQFSETDEINEKINYEDVSEVEKSKDLEQSDNEDKNLDINNDQSKQDESKSSEYNVENIRYEGSVAVYTDPKSGYQYEWSADKNEWVPRSNSGTYGFEDDTHTYTDADGAKYFWNVEKSAWFPKIDDDFLAQYQMNYGFVENTSTNKVEIKPETTSTETKKLEKRKASTPAWFNLDDNQNNKVYVSNLPLDITQQEFIDLMQKCGLIMRDTNNGQMKIKLYAEKNNPEQLKGDALCTYIKIESVELALNLLDGYDVRGHKIKVERAKFQMKGNEYDPRLKPKKKKRKELDKIKRMQEKLFDWRPEKMRGERAKYERVVIVKNLFEPTMFDADVSLILEYQQDLREECVKCGDVRRVVIYDRHPEGVAQITMKEAEEADQVVTLLNNRWFGKRQITAEIWDGKTKYKIAEQDAQLSKRLDNWEKFLQEENQTDLNKDQILNSEQVDDKQIEQTS